MAETASPLRSAARKVQNKSYFQILRSTVQEWLADEAPVMAAALAYFAFLSLAPTLVILLKIVAVYYGEAAAQGKLVEQLQTHLGPQAAQGIQEILKNMHQSRGGTFATIISLAILLASATGMVAQLKRSLNHMWNVEPRPGLGVKGLLRDRVLALILILATGCILLASMIASAVISGMTHAIEQALPIPALAVRLIELGVSAAVITLLFAVIYKYLPDVKIAWRNVWVGAVTTAVLFVIGKFLIGLYLGKSSVASSYGAAGSLVLLLIWIYYSSLILFLGAEFTQVYSRVRGEPVRPSKHAIPADSPEALARKPRREKAVQHGEEPEEGEKEPAEAGSQAAPPDPSAAPVERSGKDLTVRIPSPKERGSLIGGVLSFLAVQAASRAARRRRKSGRAA